LPIRAFVPVGFLPPHLANPPTKRPLVALMTRARAIGVSVIVAIAARAVPWSAPRGGAIRGRACQ
jgi:hypothetical protein